MQFKELTCRCDDSKNNNSTRHHVICASESEIHAIQLILSFLGEALIFGAIILIIYF